MNKPLLTIKIYEDIDLQHEVIIDLDGKVDKRYTINQIELYNCIIEAIAIRLLKQQEKMLAKLKGNIPQ